MKKKRTLRPAVFLDRDGTLIPDLGYLSDPAKVRLFAKTGEALRALRKAGFYLFVVTNQSGVARGYFPESRVRQVHRRLQALLKAQGARVDAFFYCPHHPHGKVKSLSRVCDCRKPRIGMVRQAMSRYPTALDRSYMVGDKIDDILLARNAGMARGFLVCTGNGRKSAKEKKVLRSTSSRVVHHIGQAARCILSQKEPK